jgi:UDP-GlcNAc:undecaprenyl-phosphate GlcNAc-1-phosphate transferase
MRALSSELAALISFLVALLATALATPLARRLAVRTQFLDHPAGYKEHLQPTPYLGGLAVFAGFAIGAGAITDDASMFAAFALCGALLLFVGTLDDRSQQGVTARLVAQIVAAGALWGVGFGWEVGNEAADLLLTIVWVVGVVNAFNLMDNLDGATGAVGAVSSLGVGTLALHLGDEGLGAIAFALAGACAGFLPFNLARPSRIFLGDGGSMLVGVVVAGAVMALSYGQVHSAALFASAPLVGLPMLDTALVVISRHRRGAPILSGGRDHLTHRLMRTVRSERRVALILAAGQALLCALAFGLHELGPEEAIAASAAYLGLGVLAIALLEQGLPVRAREEAA